MRVEIPEYETFVDFPDDIDPAEIERTMAENFPPKGQPAPKPTRWQDTFTSAIKGAASQPEGTFAPTTEEINEDAAETFETPVGRAIAGGVIDTAKGLGTLAKIAGRELQDPQGAAKSIMQGPAGQEIAEGVGSGLETAGTWVEDMLKPSSEKYAQPEKYRGKNPVDNPEILAEPDWWIDTVGRGAPSMAASLVPAFAAGKVLQYGGKALSWTPAVIDRIARLGAAVSGGAVGGGLEGAGTYEQALQMGMSEPEARSAAEKMTLISAGLNAISLDKALGSSGKSFVGKLWNQISKGITEGVTEGAEEPAQALLLGTDLKQSLKDATTTGLAGFALGSLVPGSSTRRPTPRNLDEYIEQNSQRKLVTPAPVTATPPGQPSTQPVAGEGLELVAGEQGQVEPVLSQNEPAAPLRRGTDIDLDQFKESLRKSGVDPDAPQFKPVIDQYLAKRKPEQVDRRMPENAGWREHAETAKKLAISGDEAARKELIASGIWGSPEVGLMNKSGWDALPRKKHQVYLDMDDLTMINGIMGHPAGDTALKEWRAGLAELEQFGIRVAHKSGDEHLAESDDYDILQEKVEALRQKLSTREFTADKNAGDDLELTKGGPRIKLDRDTTIVKKGIGFSYGIGQDENTADSALAADKSDRTSKGIRGPGGFGRNFGAVPRGERAGALRGRTEEVVPSSDSSLIGQAASFMGGKTRLDTSFPFMSWRPSTKKSDGKWQQMTHDQAAEWLEKVASGEVVPRTTGQKTFVKRAISAMQQYNEREADYEALPPVQEIQPEESAAQESEKPDIGLMPFDEAGGVAEKGAGYGKDSFKLAKPIVDGRAVRNEIPNRSSIESSLTDYTILKGVREVPFSAFEQMGDLSYYSKSEEKRTKELAEKINDSSEINPLIVVIDKNGPYILEGGHRFDALREINAKSFPALVVLDNESLAETPAFSLTPEQPKVATPKPVQSGIDLGLKGDALRAPERGVGSSEPTELERASNEKADREKQGGFFDKVKDAYKRSSLSSEGGSVGEKSIAPTFYSKLQSTLEKSMPNRATADVVRSIIKDVKADEIKWSDIDTYLNEHKGIVDKKDLLDFLKKNQVEIQEVVKGATVKLSKDLSDWLEGDMPATPEEWTREQGRIEKAAQTSQKSGTEKDAQRLFSIAEEAGRYAEGLSESGSTYGMPKFASYQVPGGLNYREMLLTLPAEKIVIDADELAKINKRIGTLMGEQTSLYSKVGGRMPNVSDGKAYHDSVKIANELYALRTKKRDMGRSNDYRSSHWDEPNVLAHVRMNDRTDADGKKVLFIEEVQSDWHQQGKRVGYNTGEVEPPEAFLQRRGYDTEKLNSTQVEREAIALGWGMESSGVPPAPFSKSWPLLAMKRMIRYAAENGYDRIAWTTGEMQNERYDLSKQVKKVSWSERNADDGYELNVVDNHNQPHNIQVKDKNELADTIGKDLAEKIVTAQKSGEQHGYFAGLELKIGGTGMKGFYDSILPSEVNKYVKKWGGRVSTTEIETAEDAPKYKVITKQEYWKGDREHAGFHPPKSPNDPIVVMDLGDGDYRQTGPDIFKNRAEAQSWADKSNREVGDVKAVPFIDITPSMKSTVMHQGQELYSFPAGPILQAIRAAKDAKAAYPHLVNLGQRVMLDGKTKFADFQSGMKSYLGDLWQKFKSMMMDIYFAAKAANKKLGQRGRVGEPSKKPTLAEWMKAVEDSVAAGKKVPQVVIDDYLKRGGTSKSIIDARGAEIAKSLDLIYNGIQEKVDGTPDLVLFTDKETKGTMSVKVGIAFVDTVKARLGEMKAVFEKVKKAPSGEADTGGYARISPEEYAAKDRSPIEMPELVELARQVNNGKFPLIAQKLAGGAGERLGVFHHRDKAGSFGSGEGDIYLRADIFAGEKVGQTAYKPKGKTAEERAIDATAAFKTFKADVLAKTGISEDKVTFRRDFDKRTHEHIFTAFNKDAELSAKVLRHEIGHLVDWLPDETVKRGNILGHVATLKKYLKTTIDALPVDDTQVLTTERRAELKKEANKTAMGEKWHWSKGQTAEQKADVKQEYDKLINKELKSRDLITKAQVMDELKSLTRKWKPFDDTADEKYTDYRYKSTELYADAVSVLFSDPAMLKAEAPLFNKSFLGYMERKPEVKTAYDAIMERNKNRGAVVEHRLENIYDMFERGVEARKALNEKNEIAAESVADTIMRVMVDKEHAKLKTIRQVEKMGGDAAQRARDARLDIEETAYLDAVVSQYFYDLDNKVMAPLKAAGATMSDTDAIMMLERIAGSRSEIANPLGHTKESATEALAGLNKKLGADKFSAAKSMSDRYRDFRESFVFPLIEKSGMYTQEQIDLIKKSNRGDYAKFSVFKYFEDKFGGAATARIIKQYGTVSEIESPFTATVLQDISMIRAAKINEAKQSMMKHLADVGGIEKAEQIYSRDAGGQKAVEPKDPKKGLLAVMQDGKLSHYYVAKPIANTYEYNPILATKAAHIWGAMSAPFRAILVSKNPAWMVRNVIRDFKQTVKNVPEVKLRDIPKLAVIYKDAYKEAFAETFKGKRSKDIEAMNKGSMLVPQRVYETKESNFENEIERRVNSFALRKGEDNEARNRVQWAFHKINNFLEDLGRTSEIGGKVAGYKFLKKNSKLSEREIGHRVRTRIGTPDYRRTGTGQQITNNVFMFSNVGKEGMRSAWESYGEDKSAYIWKTIITNIMPKLLLVGLAVSGDDDDKAMVQAIPEYDKRFYDIVPLGKTEDGKTAYLRIPQDYEGQFWGGLAWDLAHGKLLGKDGAMSLIAEQSPYSWHPLITASADLYQYYVKGINPLDSWQGKPVISDTAFKAGGKDANVEMAKHTWSELGGRSFYQPEWGGISKDRKGYEKLLSVAPFTALGTFLKFSDRGIADESRKITEQVEKERAKRAQDKKKAIIGAVNDGKTSPEQIEFLYNNLKEEGLVTSGVSLNEFTAQVNRYKLRKDDDPRLLSISFAQSNEAKEALLANYKKSMKANEYRAFVEQLREERIISKNVKDGLEEE